MGGRRPTVLLVTAWIVLSASLLVTNHFNDILKQWAATRCIMNGVNPYSVALNVLDNFVGDSAAKLKNITEIREVMLGGQGSLVDACRPTDTTYSPAALGSLTVTMGFLRDEWAVSLCWFLVNLAFLFSLTHSPTMSSLRGEALFGIQKNLILTLAFVPVLFALEIGQFSIMVLAGLLWALDNEDRPLVAGAALFLVMLKPTMGVPLLALFTGGKRWLAVAVCVALCLAFSLVVAVMTGTAVQELYRQWFRVGWYYGWNKHWSMTADAVWYLRYLLLGGAFVAAYLSGRIFGKDGVVYAGVFSMSWTYNSLYDFVLCLPFFVMIFGSRMRQLTGLTSGRAVRLARGLTLVGYLAICAYSLLACLIVQGVLSSGWGVVNRGRAMLVDLLAVASLVMLFTGACGKYGVSPLPFLSPSTRRTSAREG